MGLRSACFSAEKVHGAVAGVGVDVGLAVKLN